MRSEQPNAHMVNYTMYAAPGKSALRKPPSSFLRITLVLLYYSGILNKSVHCPPNPASPEFPTPGQARRVGAKSRIELYDLKTDPGEEHDVRSENPAVVEGIARIIKTARTDVPEFSIPGI